MKYLKILMLLFLASCSCPDKELGFPIGEKIPPYPDKTLVEEAQEFKKYIVDDKQPCGVVHRYYVTTTSDDVVLSMWRKW